MYAATLMYSTRPPTNASDTTSSTGTNPKNTYDRMSLTRTRQRNRPLLRPTYMTPSHTSETIHASLTIARKSSTTSGISTNCRATISTTSSTEESRNSRPGNVRMDENDSPGARGGLVTGL